MTVPYRNRPLGGVVARRLHEDGSAMRNLQAGQAHTQYGLILMLIDITVIGALTLLGQQVHEMWHSITAAMPRQVFGAFTNGPPRSGPFALSRRFPSG